MISFPPSRTPGPTGLSALELEHLQTAVHNMLALLLVLAFIAVVIVMSLVLLVLID